MIKYTYCGKRYTLSPCTLSRSSAVLVEWHDTHNTPFARVFNGDPAILDGPMDAVKAQVICGSLNPDPWKLFDVTASEEHPDMARALPYINRRFTARGLAVTVSDLLRALSLSPSYVIVDAQGDEPGQLDTIIGKIAVSSDRVTVYSSMSSLRRASLPFGEEPAPDPGYEILYSYAQDGASVYEVCYDDIFPQDFASLLSTLPGDLPVYIAYDENSQSRTLENIDLHNGGVSLRPF